MGLEGFRVQGLTGFPTSGLRLRFRLSSPAFRVQGLGFEASGAWFRVYGLRFGVKGFGLSRVWHINHLVLKVT